ncbi:MAG: hypothetical protein SVO01_00620 [Thermotogota bacterium]|nr:hypothetical protein [Thermotogota bacterium]
MDLTNFESIVPPLKRGNSRPNAVNELAITSLKNKGAEYIAFIIGYNILEAAKISLEARIDLKHDRENNLGMITTVQIHGRRLNNKGKSSCYLKFPKPDSLFFIKEQRLLEIIHIEENIIIFKWPEQ